MPDEIKLFSTMFLLKPEVLSGLEVRVLRKSERTGCVTVECVEERGAYKLGTTMHVMPYELAGTKP